MHSRQGCFRLSFPSPDAATAGNPVLWLPAIAMHTAIIKHASIADMRISRFIDAKLLIKFAKIQKTGSLIAPNFLLNKKIANFVALIHTVIMLFTTGNILLIGSILLFVSIVVGKTGYRFGVPTLLLFLLVGMLFGSDGLGIQFHNAFEAQFIGMVALCVILFSGGMDTGLREIKPILAPGIVLSTVGVLLTALLTGVFIWWISGMSWSNIYFPITTSLLLAATMSSTDSASVFAILRSQKINLKHNLRPMLELESGSNDPMAFMLTIVLIQLINTAGMGVAAIVTSFLVQFAVGALAGYVFGRLAVLMLNRLNIDNQSLYPILLLAFVFSLIPSPTSFRVMAISPFTLPESLWETER